LLEFVSLVSAARAGSDLSRDRMKAVTFGGLRRGRPDEAFPRATVTSGRRHCQTPVRAARDGFTKRWIKQISGYPAAGRKSFCSAAISAHTPKAQVSNKQDIDKHCRAVLDVTA